jgi:Vacuolar membrane protease, C-terminal domain
VHLALAILSFLLIIPIAPFVHKLHHYVAVCLVLVLLGTGIYNLVAFPFSTTSPLKVFFYQSVDLETGANAVNVTGLAGYVDKHIIPGLPSARGQAIVCSDSTQRPGLRTCQWEGLTPAVVPNKTNDWLSSSASLSAPGTALIKVKGINTRSCKIYFDHPVSIRVENSTGDVQNDYPFPSDGITELHLWSRTWNKEFEVSATWKGQKSLTGRVSCGWAETSEGRIPAFTEVVGFLPAWALVTKASDALVEGMRSFSV